MAIFGIMIFGSLNGQPLNDDIGFATVIPHTNGWTSANAAYTTNGATADGNAGTCWNTSPNYNVWFRFQATGPMVKITIRRGGVYGTIARINAAIWQVNGTTQVACKTYVNDFDEYHSIHGSCTGNWYYLSVDNNYAGYRGTFSLLMETALDYDFYEGAIEIPHTDGWTSVNAAYSTIGATPDKIPEPAGTLHQTITAGSNSRLLVPWQKLLSEEVVFTEPLHVSMQPSGRQTEQRR